MQPFLVGVAGGTGSGKTTVARKIAGAVPAEMVAILEHDSYYLDRPDLTYEDRCQLNFDHPDALESSLLLHHVRELKRGRAVEIPMYDFKIHRRSPYTRRVEPTTIIVVEGILIFSDPELRAELDLKLFVDTDADIRVLRRVRRDMEHRGRSFEAVREQYYSTVRPMHLQFVEPSKRWADVIIPEGGDNHVALDLIVAKIQSVLASRGRI
ncbi:uridine kinase [Sandaracinus amylolyticus]|uniref:Uridine kinase n=1 Tax=Sandaracinus amylolyticus TaxID=927083 RepID=A0A0F6W849_9BACT|nr:uridine kinase [Sandaracinus amylolyticus]AKF09817.1 Uridine kinase [Sandaracinus amylolyticus]